MGKNEECVSVVVRCRPLNGKEISKELESSQGVKSRGDLSGCIRVTPHLGLIEIRKLGLAQTDPGKSFSFDTVYDWNSKQSDLYEETFSPLVECVLQGFNGTIFAYGQTGTGKTFTMEGSAFDPGVIPRSFQHIFQHIASAQQDWQYLVRASYLEIYQEEIRDLLASGNSAKKRLELKERPDTGVYVKDLSPFVCKSQSEIEQVMRVGNANRTVGRTNMNEHSSRSHAIFIITVECASSDPENGEPHIRVGKLNLVDLAGSERQAKTGAEGNRLKEATKINLSLSALGNVISALVDTKSSHIPYRDSKLTRLLQDSLGGNAKTVMVANVGPAAFNYEETLTTLRYANRAKNIKNKPIVNEDPKDAMLREFQEEIARLKFQLTNRQTRSGKRRKWATSKRPGSQLSATDHADLVDDGPAETNVKPSAEDLEARLAIDRELLEADTSMLANEKDKLLNELMGKEAALRSERVERELVSARINALESKLLSGTGTDEANDKNMVEKTNEQRRTLEKRRADLAERRKAERCAAQQLEASEEQGEEMGKTYSSLRQEVETKTRKLRKLFAKLQSVKQDILDVTDEYNRDRRDLEDTQQQLFKELKLKMLIVENFIPPIEGKKLLARATYDEEEDSWYLASPQDKQRAVVGAIAKRPVSAAGSRRPMSEYARMVSACRQNEMACARYRGENIMRLSIDRGGRTTRDYEGPAIAPRVQAALDAAMLNVEPDIEVDVSALNSKLAVRGMRRNGSVVSKNEKKTRLDAAIGGNQSSYPASRGLVPK